MSVGRGTVGRLKAVIAKARASLPPLVVVLEPVEGETREAFNARAAEARARVGEHRRVFFIIVDRDERAKA